MDAKVHTKDELTAMSHDDLVAMVMSMQSAHAAPAVAEAPADAPKA